MFPFRFVPSVSGRSMGFAQNGAKGQYAPLIGITAVPVLKRACAVERSKPWFLSDGKYPTSLS